MAQTRANTKQRSELKYPTRFNVLIHNDDHTPVDFVVDLLIHLFHHNIDTAKAVTMQVHENGVGIAGTYSKEVAEQKTVEGISAARNNGYPLRLSVNEA